MDLDRVSETDDVGVRLRGKEKRGGYIYLKKMKSLREDVVFCDLVDVENIKGEKRNRKKKERKKEVILIRLRGSFSKYVCMDFRIMVPLVA